MDKTAVLSTVRDRWNRLAAHPLLDVTLMAPVEWKENYRSIPYDTSAPTSFRTVLGRTVMTGHELLGAYLSGPFKAMRAAHPDVILMMEESFSAFALQVLAAKRIYAPNARLIFYNHNVTSYRRFMYRLSPLYKIFADVATPRMDLGLNVSTRAEEVLREAGYPVDALTLYYGVDERRFAGAERTTSRRALGIPEKEVVILYAGRLMWWKGIHHLIEGVDRIRKLRPELPLRLVIIGSGDYAEPLHEKVRELDMGSVVDFYPAVPIESVPQWLAAADMHVLPSLKEFHEQFGRINVEAMLCGTTVVASDSGSLREVIGDGGFIFTAGDVDDLVRTVLGVLDDPEEAARRRERGTERALNEYSTSAFLRKLVALLEQMTGIPLVHRTPEPI